MTNVMTESVRVDVLIVGGGTAGVAAAWQAAKCGARTLVVEESPWIGGMLTAAGVSAVDGNEGPLAGGMFRRFREAIEEHYGGSESVRTGWVSNTCYEPHVGERILSNWIEESGAEVWRDIRLVEILRKDARVEGAIVERRGERVEVRAQVTIDGTEFGDVLAMGNVPFRLGRESKEDTGEADAPDVADLWMQDMTWVATLTRVAGVAEAIPEQEEYGRADFDCSTSVICSTPDPELLNHPLHDWDSFISYGKLPGNKYMLNWPFHCNDSPMDPLLFGTREERERVLERSRHRTLAYIRYIQKDLRHPEFGLADEFGTEHKLAHIPYIRESRRVVGVSTVLEEHVVPAEGATRPLRWSDSIAVGDYPLDHHHWSHHLEPKERIVTDYPDTAPFEFPYSALVPQSVDGLLAIEKNSSVTHISNGCTRLQPIVMSVGQAAGAAAAQAAEKGIEPREIDTARLQRELLAEGCVLTPLRDVDAQHPHFAAIQTLTLRTGEVEPYEFDAERVASQEDARSWAERWRVATDIAEGVWRQGMTRGELASAIVEATTES